MTNAMATALNSAADASGAALEVAAAKGVEAGGGWLDAFGAFVERVDGVVWGPPMIVVLLAVGASLSLMLRFRHLLDLGNAFRYMFHTEEGTNGEVSSFAALCTALSATIGTGNIVGVATAIGLGGPGALFWMEVAAFFGMATKYAEGLLAVRYREIGPDGRVLGGPFRYIERGLGRRWRWLAVMFAVFGVGAGLLGIGTIAQVHGITSAVQRLFNPGFNPADPSTGFAVFGFLGVETTYSAPVIAAGLLVTVCTALVVIGGLRRIAAVSTVVVPFMAVLYVASCALVLVGSFSRIPAAVWLIVRAAFSPAAVAGGAAGSMFVAMQMGVARGIFSNEAGLGSAPIAAAAARTNEPARQGLVCMTGTFIDTIVVCSMTGLVIVVTGAWEPSLGLKGVDVTIEAFRRGLSFLPGSGGVAPFLLMVSLAFFAFTTILGWNYYSEKCLEYLAGPGRRRVLLCYRVMYVFFVFIGPYLTLSVVWDVADVMNGLMAFPNIVALALLAPVVRDVTREFFDRRPAGGEKRASTAADGVV